MIIVKDIQDATTMKKVISSIVRRSVAFKKTPEQILVDLIMVIEDLDKNIEREDLALDAEYLQTLTEGARGVRLQVLGRRSWI